MTETLSTFALMIAGLAFAAWQCERALSRLILLLTARKAQLYAGREEWRRVMETGAR